MKRLLDIMSSDPGLFYEMIKLKDKDGESIFTHFITTNQSDVLDSLSMSQAVSMLWLGSVIAESPFM